MGRTVRRQIVRGRNLVGTNCKGRIIGGRSVRGQTVGVPILSIYTTEIYISVYREEDNEFIFSVMFIYHSIEQRKLFNLICKAREYKTEIAKQ